MPLESTVQETAVVARQLGGRPIDDSSLLWKTLFPMEALRIDGRVATESSCNFLTQTRLNPTKELIAVAFSPANVENGQNFKAISDFLIGKRYVVFVHVREMTQRMIVPHSRHGLIFPWGMPPKEHSPGREFYVVPLRVTDPLPECIELLDHLKLPKERDNDYLIGVWVLYKGRLAPPAQIKPIPPTTQAPPLPPLTANIASTIFGNPTASPAKLDTSKLADLAALTPEQIHNVIRSLTAPPQIPLPRAPQLTPQAPGQPPPPLPTLHPMAPMPILPQQPQPWSAHPPAPYPVPYHPPLPMQPPQLGPHGIGGPPPPPFDRQDQREFKREPKPPGSGPDRNDRSDRGPRRNRGRRGRDGGTSPPRRPVDSGWPQRKAWTEGRGGGPPSPTRKW